MRKVKRVAMVTPIMALNGALVGLYPKDLLGGGNWTTKTRKRIKKKYFVHHDQYEETKAATMKGTLIYSEIRGLHLLDHSRSLHELHQELKNVTS